MMHLIRRSLGRLTPGEQLERYRAARQAYVAGSGSLDAVRKATTPAVAELLSLQEQAAARRKREAAEAEARAAAEAKARAAAARRAGFRYDALTAAGAIAFAVMAAALIGTVIMGARLLAEHLPRYSSPRPVAGYSVTSFTGPGTLTVWDEAANGPRTIRVLSVIEHESGGLPRYITWFPADGSPPQITDGAWAFFPDDPAAGPLGSNQP
jgi:hypothetical protein